MAIKNKGNKTKEKIILAAKQEFYEMGYRHALINNIAKRANIALGNLTYYYSKDDMVKDISEQFMNNVNLFIKENCDCGALKKYCYNIFIAYTIILSDEHNKRFFNELISNKSSYRIHHELTGKSYLKVIQSLDIELSKINFEIIILSLYGARREIFLSYFEGNLEITVQELIFYIIANDCMYLDINKETVKDIIEECNVFIKENDLSKLKYLI